VPPPRLIEWGAATLALPGEAESGDRFLVAPAGRGVLLAVVDGLGHGAEAAEAARTAVATLERHAGEPPSQLIQRCHHDLRGTRGVVMSVAAIDGSAGTVTWLGVGNVAGVLRAAGRDARPARASLIAPGGIVGSELPRLHPHVLPLARGDLILLATDGVREGFADGVTGAATPQQLADRILARFGKGTDDALTLVARYLGGAEHDA
jgi:phosphoserine phosphatase RsbX